MLRIDDDAPNVGDETTQGRNNFHEWINDGWVILFSHPKNFTPGCTTELGYMAGLEPEFFRRNRVIVGRSVDPVSSHGERVSGVEQTQGQQVNYPTIGDSELSVAKLCNMLPADAGDACEGRTAATNATVRTVFVIGPDNKITSMLSDPMSTGCNFDEVLRLRDSLQLTAAHEVATSVPDEEAKDRYPAGRKAPRPYWRVVAQPK